MIVTWWGGDPRERRTPWTPSREELKELPRHSRPSTEHLSCSHMLSMEQNKNIYHHISGKQTKRPLTTFDLRPLTLTWPDLHTKTHIIQIRKKHFRKYPQNPKFLTFLTKGQKSSLDGVMKRRTRIKTAGVASPTMPPLQPAWPGDISIMIFVIIIWLYYVIYISYMIIVIVIIITIIIAITKYDRVRTIIAKVFAPAGHELRLLKSGSWNYKCK